ncbi:MAG TPA: sugar phosphate isomerase/epimerase family protein [Propionicimonas sp.]|nr:sugar phosphate isomerase/epimerase family protein [Propionicimonas sp.]
MWTLSGFADEISPDLDEQVALVTSLGLRYIELRSAWDVNVLDLDGDQLCRVKTTLDGAGLGVSSIGSPIGKIAITDDNAPHLDRMRHAADVAKLFGAPFIRMFSYFMPAGADPDGYRDEVIARIGALAAIAEDAGVTLIHENEKEIFGDIPRRCLDIVEAVNSPALALTWDNANFVQCGVRPFTEAYPLLAPHVAYLQVKDALADDGTVVPAGEGDGEFRETMRAFAARGFDGFVSLEPHLGYGHSLGGFSGPENWTRAYRAFTAVLDDEGIAYS